jgi:hypothetical protein
MQAATQAQPLQGTLPAETFPQPAQYGHFLQRPLNPPLPGVRQRDIRNIKFIHLISLLNTNFSQPP